MNFRFESGPELEKLTDDLVQLIAESKAMLDACQVLLQSFLDLRDLQSLDAMSDLALELNIVLAGNAERFSLAQGKARAGRRLIASFVARLSRAGVVDDRVPLLRACCETSDQALIFFENQLEGLQCRLQASGDLVARAASTMSAAYAVTTFDRLMVQISGKGRAS